MNRTHYYIYIAVLLLLFGAATTTHAQTIRGNIYGGGNLAQVEGSTTIDIKSGGITAEKDGDGNIYGGGYGASAVLTGNTTINVTGGTIAKDVYGGGALANVTGSTEVNIDGGTVTQDVYGGGALANVSANTSVNLTGGTIRSSYGGGLGQLADAGAGKEAVEAIVNGDATVTLGKLQDKADPSDPDIYTASKVNGSVFGANNINGTPKGHVLVHVLNTTPREGQGAEEYDVAAVYGGGNLAAYIPSEATLANNEKNFAEVFIENCDNSIAYVYGGGNAAPVPATQVTIKGANAIDNAFAGGNGAGADNPGADIGYKGFFSSGAATEYGTGVATIYVQGGTIHHVYGGSNTLGYIKDHAEVNVNAEGTCTMDVAELYGGGKKAPGKAATINITCTGEEGRIENVYGGAHMADLTGDITLNINGGNIGNAFGGNNESGTIDGAITVNVNWDTDACGTNSLTNVYGGGNKAAYSIYGYKLVDEILVPRTKDEFDALTEIEKTDAGFTDGKPYANPTINLQNGIISNNVYGGGLGQTAVVTGDPTVNLIGATVTNDIFGGGDAAPVTGNPLVTANYGSVKDIFAGGSGRTAVVTGDPKAYVNKTDDKELTVVDVYGGGDAANVVGTGKVQLDKGTVTNIYGGGNAANVTNTDVIINGGEAAMAFAGGHGDKNAEPQKEANVTGDAHLTIHGGTVAKAFAGSNSKGTITGSQLVTIVKDANALAELHVAEVYGGGNQADGKAGTFDIGCTGGETEGIGDLFGGAREANITGNIAFTIEGGKIDRIFGGNNVSGNVAGSITVNIAENTTKYDCGLHAGYVYGGGQDAAYAPTTPGAYPAVNIIGGSIANDVFGGGLGATAVVTSNPTITISGGSVGNNVFGGGSLAETDGNPVVNVTGGTVSNDVYGGGALANITGNTTVNLTGGAVGSAYGGGLGQLEDAGAGKEAIAALVTGNTLVTLNGTAVTGDGIFGANNINGTPKGHVKVHVTKTTPREGQTAGQYDVPAVYGGGNKAAYEPTSGTDFAEVLIENCDNSIAYVYGGGNAAPVPATQVKIYGANAIDKAFAGGNGAGDGNPGADVGYLGYFSRGNATDYGTGKASIAVYGGTVHNVFGGSNTLGYIRGGSTVEVGEDQDYTGTSCSLIVTNVYGAGNEADMYGNLTMTLNCSKGVDVIYAGANNADINGNITLNLLSGTFGKVFCGNNAGGAIRGKVTLNVDETGCWPIYIQNLYGGGNLAPYSQYGYYMQDDKLKCRTKAEFDALTADQKAEAGFVDGESYGNPTVNVISATRIANIYGGGYGADAVVYGDPTINVNMIKGAFAGQTPTPERILDANDEIVGNDMHIEIPDEVGTIGTIYGGGEMAPVEGNTYVNIGREFSVIDVEDTDQIITIGGNDGKGKHIYGSDRNLQSTQVNITGDVYGGGRGAFDGGNLIDAYVSGTTNVKIGKDK